MIIHFAFCISHFAFIIYNSFRIYNFEFTKKGDASLHRPQETNYYAAYLFTYKPDYVRSSQLYLMDHSYS